jgi:hypothetical protein
VFNFAQSNDQKALDQKARRVLPVDIVTALDRFVEPPAPRMLRDVDVLAYARKIDN